jgi:hypothetical protein
MYRAHRLSKDSVTARRTSGKQLEGAYSGKLVARRYRWNDQVVFDYLSRRNPTESVLDSMVIQRLDYLIPLSSQDHIGFEPNYDPIVIERPRESSVSSQSPPHETLALKEPAPVVAPQMQSIFQDEPQPSEPDVLLPSADELIAVHAPSSQVLPPQNHQSLSEKLRRLRRLYADSLRAIRVAASADHHDTKPPQYSQILKTASLTKCMQI